MGAVIEDSFGRILDYVRISVTDRCNFRCVYCMPEEGVEWIPHERILTYEDILFLCDALVSMGVKRIRFTGGEPFVRKGFVSFLEEVRRTFPELRLAVTTNGSLLAEWAEKIALLGLDSLNVSLDTLDEDKFRRTTKTDKLCSVIKGIDSVLLAKGPPLKINAVIMRGFNDDEIPALLRFASERGALMRLIEFMPLDGDVWSAGQFVSAGDMLNMLPDRPLWRSLPGRPGDSCGPSRYYENEKTGQRIGIISAVSDHFCGYCNRLRISSVGEVLPCLFSSSGYSLREALKNRDRDGTRHIILKAAASKPRGGEISLPGTEGRTGEERHMSRIGG